MYIIKVYQEDIDQLAREIEAVKEVGSEQLFFKFKDNEQWFTITVQKASNLLIYLTSMYNSETIHLTVDIETFLMQ